MCVRVPRRARPGDSSFLAFHQEVPMPSTICRLDALSSLSRTLRNLPILWLILAVLLLAVPSWPQQALRPEARRDIPPSEPASRQTPAPNPAPGEPPVTLPAGTQLALVLTHPLDSTCLSGCFSKPQSLVVSPRKG